MGPGKVPQPPLWKDVSVLRLPGLYFWWRGSTLGWRNRGSTTCRRVRPSGGHTVAKRSWAYRGRPPPPGQEIHRRGHHPRRLRGSSPPGRPSPSGHGFDGWRHFRSRGSSREMRSPPAQSMTVWVRPPHRPWSEWSPLRAPARGCPVPRMELPGVTSPPLLCPFGYTFWKRGCVFLLIVSDVAVVHINRWLVFSPSAPPGEERPQQQPGVGPRRFGPTPTPGEG